MKKGRIRSHDIPDVMDYKCSECGVGIPNTPGEPILFYNHKGVPLVFCSERCVESFRKSLGS